MLLLTSIYSALGTAVQKAYPDQLTTEDIKARLPEWVDRLKTTDLQVVKAEHNTTTQIVDETVSTAMRYAVDGISVFLFGGFVASLFIGRRTHVVEPR